MCITLYPVGHKVPISTESTVPGRSHVSVIASTSMSLSETKIFTAMALFLTDLVLCRQKCRFFDVEHKGGNKHIVRGTVIKFVELAYPKRYGWLNYM